MSEERSGFLADAPEASTEGFMEGGQPDAVEVPPPPRDNPPIPEAKPTTPHDPLVDLASKTGFSDGVLAQRVLQIEDWARRLNQDVILPFQQAATNFESRVRQLEQVVQAMAQQRGVAELQMERHTRSVALDLAIKMIPEAVRSEVGSETITTYAAAFLAYMKGGEQ